MVEVILEPSGSGMTAAGLFEALPDQLAAKRVAVALRLSEPAREGIELRAVSLDSLPEVDHPARLISAYVLHLDLSELESAIKAREGVPGQPGDHAAAAAGTVTLRDQRGGGERAAFGAAMRARRRPRSHKSRCSVMSWFRTPVPCQTIHADNAFRKRSELSQHQATRRPKPSTKNAKSHKL